MRPICLPLLLCLVACTEDPLPDSGGPLDVGARDAAPLDAAPADAARDASAPDAPAPDAPARDADPPDLGPADSGAADTGLLDSGEVDGGDACGFIGQACPAGQKACPGGLTCLNGVCMPAGRPDCGGFVMAQCPPAFPVCRYYTGADYGTCLLPAERACICALPTPPITCP